MGRLVDLSGQRFGKLLVVERAPSRGGRTMWRCKCDCGAERLVQGGNLKSGISQSCGCIRGSTVIRHGLWSHPLYKVYDGMKQRCYNDKHKAYSNYGERGVTVCDEWKDDFLEFYNWAIGEGWEKGLHIDRIDGDGDYSPCNCRLVLQSSNNLNVRARSGCSSTYKGVQWHKVCGKWVSGIKHDKKNYYLGLFEDEIEAAIAYDKKAEELHREFAWLNREHFEEVMDRWTSLNIKD